MYLSIFFFSCRAFVHVHLTFLVGGVMIMIGPGQIFELLLVSSVIYIVAYPFAG
jgi:hypothetical protein